MTLYIRKIVPPVLCDLIPQNGYYHLQLNPNTNQTTHRVTGTLKNTTQPIKVEWESNLYWSED